jgi:hypothetical protein
MAFIRVLPRDAFNDANLLKCIGQLTLLIEDGAACVEGLTYTYDGEPFDIQQDESDGSTYVANMTFQVNGKSVHMRRPMNSRDPWPLLMITDLDVYYVFNDKGETMPSFKSL